MSYKSIAPNLSSSPSSAPLGPAPCSPQPLVSHRHQWDSVPGGTACFGPVFKDFGPPSLGYVQVTKTPSIQDSQGTYRDLLLETGKEIWPAYAKKRHHPCPRPSQRVPGRESRTPSSNRMRFCLSIWNFPGHRRAPASSQPSPTVTLPILGFLSCVPWGTLWEPGDDSHPGRQHELVAAGHCQSYLRPATVLSQLELFSFCACHRPTLTQSVLLATLFQPLLHQQGLRRLSPSCLVSWAIAILFSACLLLNMFF